MRPVREITADEENFRLGPMFSEAERKANPQLARMDAIKRDPVKPEPEGTIVLMAFRVTGYDQDCDGSLMARLEHIDSDGEATGWEPRRIGIGPDCELVVSEDEWRSMFTGEHSP